MAVRAAVRLDSRRQLRREINDRHGGRIEEHLLDHLEEVGETTIEVPVDYYWDIYKPERYDPYNKSKEFGLGDLTDDWQSLLKVLSGEYPTIGYDFVWLSTILRAVGEQVP